MEKLPVAKAVARRLISEGECVKVPELIMEAWRIARKKDVGVDQHFLRQMNRISEANADSFAKWNEVYSSSQKQSPEVDPVFLEPVALSKSAFPDFRNSVERLLVTEVEDDKKIRLSFKAWGREYNNRTPTQLYEELEKFAKDRNLPASWLIPKSRVQLQSHEQLLFERIKEACKNDPKKGSRRTNFYGDRNNNFSGPRMEGIFSYC